MCCLLLTTKRFGFQLASQTSQVSAPLPPPSPLSELSRFVSVNVVGLQGVEFTFVLFKVAVGKTVFWDQEETGVVPEGFDSLCLEGEIPFQFVVGKMVASWT